MKRAAEFFAGIGLVRMALEHSGWQVTFANDISPTKFEMYRDNFGDHDFYLGDIRAIHANSISKIALATASFPCIDLSLAGNRRGLNGQHSSAYWEFHRIISQMGRHRPFAIMLENVAGLLSSNGGQDLYSILDSLGKLGYSCDVIMVDAVHFAPQSRPRLFVICSLCPVSARNSDFQTHHVRPKRVVKFVRENPELKWNHLVLPPLPTRKHDLEDLMESFGDSSSNWWEENRQRHLYRQMSLKHKRVLHSLVELRKRTFATVYKRVRPAGCFAELRADGIAGCLRTPRGGSSKQFVIQAGYGKWKVRNLTEREYARLQGVPDSFKINQPFNQALFGFGDAVCVPAVEWVINYGINPLFPS